LDEQEVQRLLKNSRTVPGLSSAGVCSKRFAGWKDGNRGRKGNGEEWETQRHRGHREEGKGGEEKRSEPNAFSLRVSLLDLANLAPLR